MKNNDKTTGNLAKKEGDNLTDIKKLQAQIQVKPKNLKLGKSVPVLFKEKMLEKLKNNAENNIYYIDNMNLPELRNLADEVCDEIELEKKQKKASANVNRETLRGNYNLIETFILYLFKNDKFKYLQYATKLNKQVAKILDDNTEQFEQPIVQYLKPYFAKSKFTTGQSMPDILSNVFTNFCVSCKKDNTKVKLYNVNQQYIKSNAEQDKISTSIQNSRISAVVTLELQKQNKLQKGSNKKVKHTAEMIKSVISNKESKKKYNNTTKTAIFNPTVTKHTSEQKNNEEQINTKNNNNNLLNNDINVEIEIKAEKEPKINIIDNTENKETKYKRLNKKRKSSQDIEEQQNKDNKKSKLTDNELEGLIKPEAVRPIGNLNFIPQQRENQQSSNNMIRLSKNSAFRNFNPLFGNLNFTPQQQANQPSSNNINNTIKLSKNSAFSKK